MLKPRDKKNFHSTFFSYSFESLNLMWTGSTEKNTETERKTTNRVPNAVRVIKSKFFSHEKKVFFSVVLWKQVFCFNSLPKAILNPDCNLFFVVSYKWFNEKEKLRFQFFKLKLYFHWNFFFELKLF